MTLIAVSRAFARQFVPWRHRLWAPALLIGWTNVVLMVSALVLALGLSLGEPWLWSTGATLVALRVMAVVRGVTRYAELMSGHALMFSLTLKLRLALFDGLCQLGNRLMSAGRALHLFLDHIMKLDAVYLRVIAPTVFTLLFFVLAIGFAAWWRPAGLLWPLLLAQVLAILAVVLWCTRSGFVAHLRQNRRAQRRKQVVVDDVTFWEEGVFYPFRALRLKFQKRMVRGAQKLTERQAGREALAQGLVQTLSYGLMIIVLAAFPEPGEALIAVLVVLASQRLVSASLPGMLALPGLLAAFHGVASVYMRGKSGVIQTDNPALVSSSMPQVLVADTLSVHFPGALIPSLNAVSVRVDAGQKLLVSGESGSGKTTLANALCGLYQPAAGRILYGASVFERNADPAW